MVTVGVPESISVIERYPTIPALVAAPSSRLVDEPAEPWVSLPVVRVLPHSSGTPDAAWVSIVKDNDPSVPLDPS